MRSWCLVVLWVSCPELLGAGSLQPALPRSAAWLLQSCQPWSRGPARLLSAFLEWSVRSGPCVSPCHLDFGAGHGGAGWVALPVAHFRGCFLQHTGRAGSCGSCCCQCAPPVLQVLLCWGHCSGGVAGQARGALARAVRSCNPGSRQGAPRTANACPDPLLLSSRWVPPQAPDLQGQCSPPWRSLSGPAPGQPPSRCRWHSLGSQGTCRVLEGQSSVVLHPRHPALGAWMAPAQSCDPGLSLGPQVQCIATLQVGSIQAGNASECGQCFSLSWMPSKPHHHLAAGFYDGESLIFCSSTWGAALTQADTGALCSASAGAGASAQPWGRLLWAGCCH